jgi:DNA gyrase/topoisomerase IV subunit B
MVKKLKYEVKMSKEEQDFKMLTDRDHVLLRPGMYIGGVDFKSAFKYVYDESSDRFVYREVRWIPGLEKIINEIIDNSVDEHIRTLGKYANKIEIDITPTSVRVTDNGRGIPIKLTVDPTDGKEKYIPLVAWTKLRAGSNFNDEDRQGLGMNGVGSSCTNIFSSTFIGTTSSKGAEGVGATSSSEVHTFELSCSENMSKILTKVEKTPSSKNGTSVYFEPDFSRFETDSIDQELVNLIHTRIIKMASVYSINFTFNGKKIKPIQPRAFAKMFGDEFVFFEGKNWFYFITASDTDEFKQFSIINGLEVKGGSHTDLIIGDIVSDVREKLSKKYKEIKPGDIKQKLMFVAVFKNFPQFKTDSQTKENLTNSVREIKDYLDTDYVKMIANSVTTLMKTSTIMDPIVEIYKIKEEMKRRQALESADKPQKRVVSDKYLKSIGLKTNLFLCEGQSAMGGLSNVLGRDGNSYIAMRGVPLNAYSIFESDADPKKILANEEQSLIKGALGFSYNYQNLPDGRFIHVKVAGEEILASENDLIFDKNKSSWISSNSLLGFKYVVGELTEVQREHYNNLVSHQKIVRKTNQKYNYENIVLAMDSDLDGYHITGLMIGNLLMFTPDLLFTGKLKRLVTPIAAVVEETTKGMKIHDYVFDIEKVSSLKPKTSKQYVKYFKGLGSWDPESLAPLVEKEGIDKFINTMTLDEIHSIRNWLSKSCVDYRKDAILSTEFDINKI